MFVLAHLSDPHLATPLRAAPTAFANKRAVGYLSWRLSRARIHRAEVLAAMTRDLAVAGADHVVITGDIVNIALADEFNAAAAWLAGVGAAADVTVVPGNHDAYVAVPWQETLAAWAAFMSADDDCGGRAPSGVDDFPFVRRRGPVALIGLSTAVPSAPGMAYGVIGHDQLVRFERVLRDVGGEGRLRVVLLHHPPTEDGTPRRKRLLDGDAFRRIIADVGAELILHGHNHRFQQATLAGPEHPAHVFGVPSASARVGDGDRIARYHLYRIADTGDGWRVDVRARILDPHTLRFGEVPVGVLRLPFATGAVGSTVPSRSC